MLWRLAVILAGLLAVFALWWLLPVSPRAVWPAKFSSDPSAILTNGQLLTTSHDAELIIWDLASDTALASIAESNLRGFYLPPTGGWAVIEREQGVPVIWHQSKEVALDEAGAFVAFGPESQVIASSHGDGTYRLLSYDPDGKLLRSRAWRDAQFLHVVRSNPGPRLVFLHRPDQRCLTIVDLDRFEEVGTWPDFAAPQALRGRPGAACMPSSDGKYLAILGDAGITIRAVPAGTRAGFVSHPAADNRYTSFWLSSHDDRMFLLAMADRPQQIDLWDVTTDVARPLGAFALEGCEFSRDGQYLVARERRGIVVGDWHLYQTRPFRPVALLQPFSGDFYFAPDGHTLAVKSTESPGAFAEWVLRARQRDGFHLVDATTGRSRSRLYEGKCFAHFPDGKTFAVATAQGVTFWDIDARRSPWVDFGLPVVFALLLLAGAAMCHRAYRQVPAVSASPGVAIPMPP